MFILVNKKYESKFRLHRRFPCHWRRHGIQVTLPTMRLSPQKFIACGMYAFTDELRQAWQQIYRHFGQLLGGQPVIDENLVFAADESILRDQNLFIGHTCGYPLMTRLQDVVLPFCVPVFKVPGTADTQYSSRIIVAIDSGIQSLTDCRNRIAACNDSHSNSGMNVLRHAIAQLNPGKAFFSAVVESGSHWQSLEAVAEGRADVAAIDCISFQLIEDKWPEMASRVRTLGYSVKTSGLPLVLPRPEVSRSDTSAYIDKLNQALQLASVEVRQQLHLSHFATIGLADYQCILDVRDFAIDAGYPDLK